MIIGAGAATIALIADDATGIGAADDPLIPVTSGVVAKGIEMVMH